MLKHGIYLCVTKNEKTKLQRQNYPEVFFSMGKKGFLFRKNKSFWLFTINFINQSVIYFLAAIKYQISILLF